MKMEMFTRELGAGILDAVVVDSFKENVYYRSCKYLSTLSLLPHSQYAASYVFTRL